MKKKATLIMIILLVTSLVILRFDSHVISQEGVRKVVDFIASGAFIFSIMGLFLLWDKEGKRLRKDFIDPIFKPTGSEKEVWDELTGKPLYKDTEGKAGNSGKESAKRHRYAIIFAVIFVICVGVGIMLTMSSGVQSMHDVSDGMEKLTHGVAGGDGAAAADGGKQLLGGILADLKILLILAILIIACIGTGYIVYRIRHAAHRNQFRKEDQDDDFWNS